MHMEPDSKTAVGLGFVAFLCLVGAGIFWLLGQQSTPLATSAFWSVALLSASASLMVLAILVQHLHCIAYVGHLAIKQAERHAADRAKEMEPITKLAQHLASRQGL